MTDHSSSEESLQDFLRQTINAVIEVCNAGGDATTLANIASNLETLKGYINPVVWHNSPDVFPDA
jgi:hypothetical protein